MPAVIPLFTRFGPTSPKDGSTPIGAPPLAPTYGYGICRNWNLCGCQGYRGNGVQTCQSCGHGFGAHF
ncbi:hypothetical protein ABIA33_001325 [Streptacidiphilus sp. MAP12-16]